MNIGVWQRPRKKVNAKKLVRDISLQTTYTFRQNQEERQSLKLNRCLSRMVTGHAAPVGSTSNN